MVTRFIMLQSSMLGSQIPSTFALRAFSDLRLTVTVSLRSEKARRAKVLGICDPSIELCNIMNRVTMPNKKDRQHAELDTFIEGIDWSRVKWSMFLRLQKICCDW